MDIFFWGTLMLLAASCGLAIFYGLQRTKDRIETAERFGVSPTDAAINRGIDPTQAYLNALQSGKPEDLVKAPLPSFFSEELLLRGLLRIQHQPSLYDQFFERLSQRFTLKQYRSLVSTWARYNDSLGKGMSSQNVFLGELSKRLTFPFEVKTTEPTEPETACESEGDEITPDSDALPDNPLTVSDSISIGSPFETIPPLYHQYPYNDVRASDKHRFEHVYMVGKPNAGKSNTLKHMIAQDLQNPQKGVVVIAPEPELLDQLIPYIPEDRHEDLVYFDPSVQRGYVIGWNPFDFSDAEGLPRGLRDDLLNLYKQNLQVVLERAMGDFGVSMRTVLKQAVAALLQMPGSSFQDFARLIDPNDSTVRDKVVAARRIDSDTRDFWAKYKQSSYFKTAHGAVLNRLGDFLSPPLSVVFSTHTLSWKDILASPRIVFINLSRLAGDPLATAGQLIIGALQTILYQRIQLPEAQRLPHYFIFVDEFGKFVGAEASFRELFTRIRKCHVGVTVAHQSREDLPGALEGTIVDTTKTMIIMKTSARVASFYAHELQLFDVDQKKYEAQFAQLVLEKRDQLYVEHLDEYQTLINDEEESYNWSSSERDRYTTWLQSKYWTKTLEADLRKQAREASRGSYNPLILQNLQQGQAIVRLEADGFPYGVPVRIPKFIENPDCDIHRIIEDSRKRYGKWVGDDREEQAHDNRPAEEKGSDDLDGFLQ